MAKALNSIADRRDKALLKLGSTNLETAINQAVAQQLAADLGTAQSPTKKEEVKEDKLHRDVQRRVSKGQKLLIDFGAGGSAFLSVEGTNKLVRMIGDWSSKQGGGFWANNVDIMQGLPHALLGFGAYLAEIMSRKVGTADKPALPPAWREGVSEAAKVYMTLGMSNLVRAIRLRWDEKKLSENQRQALLAERDQLLQRLSTLEHGGRGHGG